MGKRGSIMSVKVRRETLQEVINSAHNDGAVLTAKYLINQMRSKGFRINRTTLYLDRVALSKENSFVRDIAESTYSQMVEDIWNGLTNIEAEAERLANEKWSRSVIIKKHRPPENAAEEANPNLIPVDSIERRLESMEFQPKATFLRIKQEALAQKMALLKGDTMNVSVAFLGQKLDDYKKRIDLVDKKGVIG